MERHVLSADSDEALARAVEVLARGGLVAFPTDTVYGVGAHGLDPQAILRLYYAKQRPRSKPIALLIADEEQLNHVVQAVPPKAARLAARFWPGPLTLVFPKHARVPDVLTAGGDAVAVRMPDHPVTLRLIRMLGAPLAASSANRSGHPDPVTAEEVVRELGEEVDLVLDGGRCPGGVPSTVVDLTVDPPVVLRVGPISEEDIARVLGDG